MWLAGKGGIPRRVARRVEFTNAAEVLEMGRSRDPDRHAKDSAAGPETFWGPDGGVGDR